jgi:hypothetical protein
MADRMGRRAKSAWTLAIPSLLAASCAPSADDAAPTTLPWRRALDAQSAAVSPARPRDWTRDRWWWGVDLERVPLDRVIARIDADTSHVDESSAGPGNLPSPIAEGADVQLAPFGGCSPVYYVRYGGGRALLCDRDRRSDQEAEAELLRTTRALARRFGLDPSARPLDTLDGARLFAIRFADRPGTRRAWSPLVDRVLASRRGSRVLLAVVTRQDRAPRRPATGGAP